ncbi:MAG: PD-(D/E)XK nuclease family protein, partial [Actinomycetota bacterium]|nr:PD-(D/E)XK nuclease family protein [Actinomycetota bacterium]
LLGGDLRALPTDDAPLRDVEIGAGGWVRAALNRPATVGRVLRAESLAPAGATLPIASPPAPRAGADPEPAGRPDPVRTLSYSRLAAWQACGYRFYLQRVLGLPDEQPAERASAGGVPAFDPRTRGSLVHAMLEHDDPDLEQIAASWGLQLSDEQRADVLRLAGAFARSPLAGRLARARSVDREQGFTVALGDTLLTGVVDVLAQERGSTWLVVDYKSDDLQPDTDLAAYVEQRYAIQQRVYALAALRGGAARVEVAYAFLERPAEPVAARFDAADADRLEHELLALAAGLLAGEYPVTAAPHRELCETCPGRRALCSYDEEQTLRPRADL